MTGLVKHQDAKAGLDFEEIPLDVRRVRMNRARHKARGSAVKNVVLVAISLCLFAIAGVKFYGLSESDKSELTEEDANTPQNMRCADCKAEWTITLREWETLSRKPREKGEKVECKECGKVSAWANSQLDFSGLVAHDTDNVWVNETGLPPKSDEKTEKDTAEPSPQEDDVSADE